MNAIGTLVFLFIVWIVVIPAFHKLGVEALRKRDPEGITASIHHPLAFAIAAIWPVVILLALAKTIAKPCRG